ncbi:DUF4142 domain-containing protein [Paracoccus sediminis]|nr:DUF4142 domain-containing protein [Paracoccus sediminis]SNR51056.1 protein of unknown function [Paracoccus sediminis]
MRRTLFATGAVAAMMPVARMSFAQTRDPAMDGTSPDADRQAILLGGKFPLLGRRAGMDKATDPAVKAFAPLEVAEQEAEARAFGAAPPDPVTTDHGTLLERMNAMPAGAECDRQYLTAQIQGRERLRALHSAYAENGSNPRANGVSIVGLPAIDARMSMLQAISSRLG